MKDSSAVCVLRGYHEWGPSAIHTLFGRRVDRCHWCGVERPELTDRERLTHLADALCDDILAMSDEEILAEAQEDGINIEAEAAKSRAAFERALTQTGKREGGEP